MDIISLALAQKNGSGKSGADGRGITSITKSFSDGLEDYYTITYTDNTTSSFIITNGEDYVLTAQDKQDIANLVDASGAGLPLTTLSDRGKFLRVNSDGNWAVEALPQAEGSVF